ncbi:MAG: DUF3618 domain-containing protein [Pseudomonadota bacterium]
MSDHNQHRHPDDIEKDIHQSRERLDSTLHKIEERFSPDQLLHTTYDYLRQGGANEFFSNLGTTIKQNPVPVLLTGAGLGWLMLRQSNPQAETPRYATNVHATSESLGQPAAVAQHSYSSQPPYSQNPYPQGPETNQGVGHNHNNGEQDNGSRLQQAKESAQHIGHSAKGAAHHLSEKAQKKGGRMHDSISHAQQGAHERFDHIKERAHQASNTSSDFIQEHPVVVAALGFALGAALAGICPSTRKEDEFLGKYRDQVVKKAANAGEEQVDNAQQAIHEKTESIKQPAEKQESPYSTPTADESASTISASSTGALNSSPSTANPSTTNASTKDVTSGYTPSKPSVNEGVATNRPKVPSTQPGLAGSNTPSGNTQGNDTNLPPRP